VKVTGELTRGLADIVKMVDRGCTFRTVTVFELVTVCWGEDESFPVSVTVND